MEIYQTSLQLTGEWVQRLKQTKRIYNVSLPDIVKLGILALEDAEVDNVKEENL